MIGMMPQESELREEEEKKKKNEELQWNQTHYQFKTILAKTKRECLDLKRQLQEWEVATGNLKFQLEQERARSLGKVWLLIVFSLIIFMFLSFQKGNYLFTLMNGMALLANWRLLYVKHSQHSVLFGIFSILLTWWVV